ncbi:hypothetical protein [Azospirillum rugosum]|uniref:Uncharacterized protein n=1 Tax=Azospirillum rugosum TaxID=416170 RepID=A0ABS4SRF7_9PROT|nr:hypothetical protein [Azospirillum rugosum]MBP2295158.1 hypothetical protein [Azospirillum rugosum]MDQ0528532.1 hypothetical protein [Azospirillum rugosum]
MTEQQNVNFAALSMPNVEYHPNRDRFVFRSAETGRIELIPAEEVLAIARDVVSANGVAEIQYRAIALPATQQRTAVVVHDSESDQYVTMVYWAAFQPGQEHAEEFGGMALEQVLDWIEAA